MKNIWIPIIGLAIVVVGMANLVTSRYKISIYNNRIVRYDRWTNQGSWASINHKDWMPIPRKLVPVKAKSEDDFEEEVVSGPYSDLGAVPVKN